MSGHNGYVIKIMICSVSCNNGDVMPDVVTCIVLYDTRYVLPVVLTCDNQDFMT